MNLSPLRFTLSSEAETAKIAQMVAAIISPGNLITLSGELGAGKTSFAREFIRSYLNEPELVVPSPTYLLAVEHGSGSGSVVCHVDLYRISHSDEVDELGIDDALDRGIVIVEWPQQGADNLPVPDLELTIEITGEQSRDITIAGGEMLLEKIVRSQVITDFLDRNLRNEYRRSPLGADASSRNYEIIEADGRVCLLMDAPETGTGQVIAGGKTYSQIAHLALAVHPFVAIANLLRDMGFRAPEIYACDLAGGLVLLEHMGEGKITDGKHHPIGERYIESGKLLAQMHVKDWADDISPKVDVPAYRLPRYGVGAMKIEVQLLVDWYLPLMGEVKDDDLRKFSDIWDAYSTRAQGFEKSIVLRDYHSPNIIWSQDEHFANRIGLIDFQDAVIGPSCYDLVSLAQDARVNVTHELERQIVESYIHERKTHDAHFDVERFEMEYALMGAQRASKILGIFVRLDKRDDKPQYRKLIPQVLNYLRRNLQHSSLSDYKTWCERVLKL